jgi:hypothetical protein
VFTAGYGFTSYKQAQGYTAQAIKCLLKKVEILVFIYRGMIELVSRLINILKA